MLRHNRDSRKNYLKSACHAAISYL